VQNGSRRFIASLVVAVVVCLVVAALSSVLILQANLRGQDGAHLAATATPTLAPTDTPAPTATPVPTSTPSPTRTPRPTPTITPSTGPVVLVLDSASGGSIADQPGEFQYTATVSTAPLRPNVVANFTVSYCGQMQYTGGTYLDPTGHAPFRSGPLLVKCSFPFTVTLTGLSLTQDPRGDEPLHGSVSFTISS
jgi:hypothetical protein